MTVLFIGSGHRNFSDFLRPKSRGRLAAYGALFDHSYAIAFTRPGFSVETLAPNMTAHPTNSASRYMAPFDALRLGKQILSTVPKGEKVIISAQDPFESAFVAQRLAKRFGAILHIQVHTDFLAKEFVGERWENRIRYVLALYFLPRADCIRVVSVRIKRSLVRRFPELERRITVLPIWSSPLSIVRVPSAKGRFNILMVSRFEPEKRIRDALAAFKKFWEKTKSGKLTIVGAGSLLDDCERLAENLGLRERVIFAGWQDNLASHYAAADVFLLTSRYEGWGVAAADAVYAGIPVVMTDVGLAGELVQDGENGIVTPVGDIDAITEALFSVLANPNRFKPQQPLERESLEKYLDRYREALYRCRRG